MADAVAVSTSSTQAVDAMLSTRLLFASTTLLTPASRSFTLARPASVRTVAGRVGGKVSKPSIAKTFVARAAGRLGTAVFAT